jgi:hypothetical protein
LPEAAGNQGTICRALRVRCGTAMSTSGATAGARLNPAPAVFDGLDGID